MMVSVRCSMIMAMVISIVLVGCGDNKKSASADNFARVLKGHYDAHPICLTLPLDWPLSVPQGSPETPEIAALAGAGLIAKAETGSGSIRYEPTSAGQPVARKGRDAFMGGTDICFARRRVVKVRSFTEPAESMGMKVSRVTYDYAEEPLGPWVTDPVLQRAFPGIAAGLSKADGTDTDALVLTDQGWQHQKDLP